MLGGEASLVSPVGALPFARRPLPRFRAGARLSDLYDLETFRGRLRYNWALCSPLGLRWGHSAVADSKALLAAHAAGSTSAADVALWRATAVLAACAPNGELLPPPLRTCGWALCNTPTIAFMVVSALRHPTCVKRILLGQWLNQTHLAGVTWCNRGAGGPDGGGPSEATIAASYVAALLTAVPVAVGAGFASQRWAFLKPFARFAPYPGVALANFLGCACMRSSDVTHGIPVYQEEPTLQRSLSGTPPPPLNPAATTSRASHQASAKAGNASAEKSVPEHSVKPLGNSTAAGWQAVRDTCATRLAMPVGNFILVPMAIWSWSALRRKPVPSAAAQVGITAVIFTLWLPIAASLYPPVGKLKVEELEPPLQAELAERVTSGGGRAPRNVIYQRGV